MIVLIDSDKTVTSRVKPRFEELGFESVMALHSAGETLKYVSANKENKKHEPISLVIIDNELEGESHNELCRQLRDNELTRNSHILVVVTSLENKTAIENARHNGASGVIVKPYGSNQFIESLKEYSQKKVVVLVDDDPVIRKLVRRLLLPYEIELIEIDDGLKANNMLNNMLPASLVLMDIGLPGMSGIQLVAKLRANNNWKKAPIVMLTSSTDALDVKKSLAAGANDYVAKPFDFDNFKTRLNRYINLVSE